MIFSSTDIENYGTRPANKKEEGAHPAIICCGGILIISFALGILAAVICYYYFGINYLVDYNDINSTCNSNIWSYVLTSLITSFVLTGFIANNTNNKEENPASEVCTGILISLIWLGIGIWGVIETGNEPCQTIRNTPLWTFANVISIVQIILGCVLTITWGICGCIKSS